MILIRYFISLFIQIFINDSENYSLLSSGMDMEETMTLKENSWVESIGKEEKSGKLEKKLEERKNKDQRQNNCKSL